MRPLSWAELAVDVIDSLTSNICVLDGSGIIVAVNRAWRLFATNNGRESNCSDIGVNYLEICSYAAGTGAKEVDSFRRSVEAVLAGTLEFFEQDYPCHSGTEHRWYLARVSPIYRKHVARKAAKPMGAVITHTNITERKLLEAELRRMATTDSLTQLANRRSFVADAEETIAAAQATNSTVSLIYFDVDHFKKINDTFGHKVGDTVLQAIAACCRSVISAPDVVARIGGEEFAILLAADQLTATVLAERLRHAVSLIRLQDMPYAPSISLGIACSQGRACALGELMKRADAALYRAKYEGRNCWRVEDRITTGEAA